MHKDFNYNWVIQFEAISVFNREGKPVNILWVKTTLIIYCKFETLCLQSWCRFNCVKKEAAANLFFISLFNICFEIFRISTFYQQFWASGFLQKVKAQPGPAHVFALKAHTAHSPWAGLGHGLPEICGAPAQL